MTSLPKSKTRWTKHDDEPSAPRRPENEKKLSEQNAARRLARQGLRISRTNIGKGVFATRKIIDGEFIGEIEGQVILDDSYESRYSFDLEDGGQLEPAPPFRFVNHSCEPNCAFELIAVESQSKNFQSDLSVRDVASAKRKLLLFAICDIESGEQLSIDYNWPASFAIRCQCKAPSCRGWIVNPKHLEPLN